MIAARPTSEGRNLSGEDILGIALDPNVADRERDWQNGDR